MLSLKKVDRQQFAKTRLNLSFEGQEKDVRRRKIERSQSDIMRISPVLHRIPNNRNRKADSKFSISSFSPILKLDIAKPFWASKKHATTKPQLN